MIAHWNPPKSPESPKGPCHGSPKVLVNCHSPKWKLGSTSWILPISVNMSARRHSPHRGRAQKVLSQRSQISRTGKLGGNAWMYSWRLTGSSIPCWQAATTTWVAAFGKTAMRGIEPRKSSWQLRLRCWISYFFFDPLGVEAMSNIMRTCGTRDSAKMIL